MISKNYLNISMVQLFFLPPFGMVPIRFDLFLKDDELSVLTSEGFPLFSFGCSSLLNRHKLSEVSK